MKKDLLVFDVETGGLNSFVNGMVTISLKVYGKNLEETIVVRPNQTLAYDARALSINGYTKVMMTDQGVSEQEAVDRVVNFIRRNFDSKPNLLAHNIVFDVQFMNALFNRVGHPRLFTEYCYYHPQDTMIIMSFLKDSGLINASRVNLMDSYKYFHDGKGFDNAHTSIADVRATEALYTKIKRFLASLK
jgi:DNA polymerase III alpha subunit (gram-positive type)